MHHNLTLTAETLIVLTAEISVDREVQTVCYTPSVNCYHNHVRELESLGTQEAFSSP